MSGHESTNGGSQLGRIATDSVVDGIAALTPKFAAINTSSSGDNTVVAAVAGKKIRVLAYLVGVSATQQLTWKSGAGTSLAGQLSFAQYGGVSAPLNQIGWFETAVGEPLVLNLGQAALTGGHLTYIEVKP